jgi:4-amino-4-deoxy-L-arabinose transferase-like glycosyltransferase
MVSLGKIQGICRGKESRVKRNIITAALIFVLFASAMLPLCAKSQVWIDEVLDSDPAYNLAFHHRLSLDVWTGMSAVEKVSFVRPPVHSLLLASLYRFFGFNRWVTLGLPLVCAALTVSIIFLIAMLLLNDFPVALSSSLLFALSSLGVNAAKWGRLNALAMFLSAVSLLFFLLAQERGKLKRYLLILASGLFLSLAVQTYQLYAFLFAGYLYFFFCVLRKDKGVWLKDLVVFLACFFAAFVLWLGFILKNKELFGAHSLFVFFTASNLNPVYGNAVARVLSDLFWMAAVFSPLSLIFGAWGIFLLARRDLRFKGILSAFVAVPVFLLFICGLLKGYYIEVVIPLLFIAMGFCAVSLFRKVIGLYRKGRPFFFPAFLLFVFLLSHIAIGAGVKYFITLKEWKARDLEGYERQLLKVIPPGSSVLGTAQDWYALNRSGSRLILFNALAYSPLWTNLDYIVLSPLVSLGEYPAAAQFIKENAYEVARIGSEGRVYTLPNGSSRHSGYSAVIFKIRK